MIRMLSYVFHAARRKQMIERYTRPEMGHLWSIQNEWQTILNVEIAACEAMAELG